MRNVFFLLKRILYYIQQNAVKIVVVGGITLATLSLLARFLFPELFVPRYDIEFTGERTAEKTSAPTAQTEWTVPPNQFGEYLVESLDLPDSTPQKTTFYEPATQRSLTFDPDRSLAQYTDPVNPPGTAPRSLEGAEQQARQFLQQLGYPDGLRLLQVKYYETHGVHYEQASLGEADIYSFEFAPEVADLPVTSTDGNTNVLSIMVSGNGVFKATLRPLFLKASVGESQNLKTVDEALEDLSLGNFTSPQVTPGSLRQGTFKLQEQILMYAFGQGKETLEPVYRFTGTFTPAQGPTVSVEVYVNAIEWKRTPDYDWTPTAAKHYGLSVSFDREHDR